MNDARPQSDDAPCGLLRTRPDGTIVAANGTFCRWLDRDEAELVQRQRFQDLLTIGCKIFHQTHWMPLMQMQGSVAEVQLDVFHQDGRSLPMLVNACVNTDGSHSIALFMATDRRKYERELLLARRQAEELLERERNVQAALLRAETELRIALQERVTLAEQLVGIVSHDLRTPLNAISLGANLLSTAQLPNGQARVVARIESAANRANRLTTDLLDFTQARIGGGLRVDRRQVNVHELVQECLEEIRLARAGCLLCCELTGAATAMCDPDRVAQVITNLVNNALVYGASGSPVTIRAGVEDALLHVSVHNRGTPIDPALLPHIFEPLRRGEHEVVAGARSVGLGLYIVREIAAAHGGSVQVESTAHEGTTFVLRIPQL